MKENRHGHPTVTRLTVYPVWATKYRYHVLEGDIKVRCRDLLIQICDAEDVRILSGVVSKDHVHIHVEGINKPKFLSYFTAPKVYCADFFFAGFFAGFGFSPTLTNVTSGKRTAGYGLRRVTVAMISREVE